MKLIKTTTLAATVGLAASVCAAPALAETVEGFARIQMYSSGNHICGVYWTNRRSVGGDDGFYVNHCDQAEVLLATDDISIGINAKRIDNLAIGTDPAIPNGEKVETLFATTGAIFRGVVDFGNSELFAKVQALNVSLGTDGTWDYLGLDDLCTFGAQILTRGSDSNASVVQQGAHKTLKDMTLAVTNISRWNRGPENVFVEWLFDNRVSEQAPPEFGLSWSCQIPDY